MICLVTFISSTRHHSREGGHMAWHDAEEAMDYARSMYGVTRDEKLAFSIELNPCEYPDTCAVQDGIRKGLYAHHPRMGAYVRLLD